MNDATDEDEPSLIARLLPTVFGKKHSDRTRRIRHQLHTAYAEEAIPADTFSMIEGVFHVSEMRVRDIMIPRAQMAIIKRTMSFDEILDTVINEAHSRYPVLSDDRDEIAGILLAKDLISVFREDDTDDFKLKDILRPAILVPEAKRLNVLGYCF